MGGLLAGLVPVNALAQSNVYPTGSRAIFLAGCLTEEPSIDLQDQDEVYSLMRTCVCLLDKFQATYSNKEFITLFDKAGRQDSAAEEELEHFTSKHYSNCL